MSTTATPLARAVDHGSRRLDALVSVLSRRLDQGQSPAQLRAWASSGVVRVLYGLAAQHLALTLLGDAR